MSQPRVRSLSAGPRRGTARPIPPLRPWWAHVRATQSSWPSAAAAAPAVARLGEAGRADRHEATLASAAAAMQTAADEAGVLKAAGAAIERLGLNALLATLEPDGAGLIVRTVALPWAGVAEVERVLGHRLDGARIDLDGSPPDRTVVRDGAVARIDGAAWWARLGAHPIERAESDAVGTLIRLGEVVLVPIVGGARVLGVLTVWSATLGPADASTAELLGRIAGGALAARSAHGGRPDDLALAAAA